MVQFRIDIVADPRPAVNANRKVQQELQRTEGGADRLRRTLINAFAAVGSALAIRKLHALGEEFALVSNRLRTVTEGEVELIATSERLLNIANDTRSAYGATAELYVRLATSAKELGRSQEELLRFTESLNRAVILSGASANEAAAGIIQLSQGIASGALRGDELRSVLEQLPAVADVIARHLGITRGELRAMGAEGRITADIVLDAFKEARGELAGKFGKTIPTVGQAMGALRNETGALVTEIDRATGALVGQASALQGVADGIRFLRESMDRFQSRVRTAEAEGALSATGAAILNLQKELRNLESRQVISDSALQRIEELRNRIEALQGIAKQTTVLVEPPDPKTVQQTADLAKAESDRAAALSAVITQLEQERELTELISAGLFTEAEALQVVFDLRAKNVHLTGAEQEVLAFMTRRNQSLRDQAAAMENLLGPQKELNKEIAILQKLLADPKNAAAVDQIRQRIRDLQIQGLEASTDLGDGFTRAFLKMQQEAENLAAVGESVVTAFADNATEALIEFARTGEFSFKAFASSVLDDLTRILARLLVVQALSAAFGAASGGAGGLAASQFGGFRAEGGPVLPGHSYVVGDGGEPEVFTPSRPGQITPVSDLAPSVENRVTVVNVDDPNAIPSAIEAGRADQAIVNVLARNRGKVSQILGGS